ATDPRVALWWSRVSFVGVPLLPAAMFAAVTRNLGLSRAYRLAAGVFWLASLGWVFLASQTELLIVGDQLHWWGYYARFGSLGVPFLLYGIGVETWAIVLHLRVGRAARSGSVQALRMRGVLVSIVVAVLAGIDFAAHLGLPIYP